MKWLKIQRHEQVSSVSGESEVCPLAFLATSQKSRIYKQLHVVAHRALSKICVRREITDACAINTVGTCNFEQ